jgi:hypothetical protein
LADFNSEAHGRIIGQPALWFTFDDNEGEKHAAIRNTDLIIFEFLLGTGIRQFSALYDECLGSRVSAC